MPQFAYQGISEGQPVKGRIRAADAFEAERLLIDRHIVVDSLEERVRIRALSSGELINFTRAMASLLRSGVPLDEAGELWREDAGEGSIYEGLFADVRSGVPLSQAMAKRPSFPGFVTAMVRMGEATGTLAEAFTKAADYLEKKQALRKTMLSALFYPAIVLFVAALAMVILFVYVLPVFQDMYTRFNAELPLITRVLIAIMDLLRSKGLVFLAGGGAALFLVTRALHTDAVRLKADRWLYRLPMLGPFMAQVHQAFFCASLGHLLRAGINLLEALGIVQPLLANHHLRQLVLLLSERVARGEPMAKALADARFFGRRIPRMVGVAEQAGDLGGTLADLGEHLTAEVEGKLKTFAGLFEPVLILFLAVVIGLVLVALYLPMFDIVSVME